MRLRDRILLKIRDFLVKITVGEKGRVEYLLADIEREVRQISIILHLFDDKELLELGVESSSLFHIPDIASRARKSESLGLRTYGMVQWLVQIRTQVAPISCVRPDIAERWELIRGMVWEYNRSLARLREEGKAVGVGFPLMPDFPEL